MNISITALSKAIALLTPAYGRQNIIIEDQDSFLKQPIKQRLSFVRNVFGDYYLESCTIIK